MNKDFDPSELSIHTTLHRGEESTVQIATLDKEEVDVVVKRFTIRDVASLARFEKESSFAVRFPGLKNVIEPFGMVKKPPHYWLVLPHQARGDLLHATKSVTNLKTILNLFLDSAIALQSLHQSKIVHRDVKPANILVSENWNANLCDFGLFF